MPDWQVSGSVSGIPSSQGVPWGSGGAWDPLRRDRAGRRDPGRRLHRVPRQRQRDDHRCAYRPRLGRAFGRRHDSRPRRSLQLENASGNKIAALYSRVFAGAADWRVPNFEELVSLLDLERSSPSLAPVFDGSRRKSRVWLDRRILRRLRHGELEDRLHVRPSRARRRVGYGGHGGRTPVGSKPSDLRPAHGISRKLAGRCQLGGRRRPLARGTAARRRSATRSRMGEVLSGSVPAIGSRKLSRIRSIAIACAARHRASGGARVTTRCLRHADEPRGPLPDAATSTDEPLGPPSLIGDGRGSGAIHGVENAEEGIA